MEIQTVKLQDEGWLINGAMSVPNDPANRHYQIVQDWIVDGNTPEPEQTADELKAAKMSKAVSMRQARLALLQAGKLADIEAAIAALPEPDKTAVSIEWEYAQDVRRDHTWVQALGAQLGMTDDELDNLFALAESL